MTTIRAVYEKGNIRLLENVPIQENQQLLITLAEASITDRSSHPVSLQQLQSFVEYLLDEREDLYQDYLKISI